MTFSQPVMYPALQSAIEKNVDLHKLVNYPQWNLKVIQVNKCHEFQLLGCSEFYVKIKLTP